MASELDVFRDTVARRRPTRLLYHFDCTPDLGRRLAGHIGGDGNWSRHYGCYQARWLSPKRPPGVPPPDHTPYWAGQVLPKGSWINHLGVLEVPGSAFHFTAYVSPLRNAASIEEIEHYPLADARTLDCSHWARDVRSAHAAGLPAIAWIGHMYENAWQVRGYEPFLEDMVERPLWAHAMLERFFQYNLYVAVAAARAGADMIQCGDDVANQRNLMFSLPMWRDFILSRWARVWRAAKNANPSVTIHYHSDGNIVPIVREMVDAGLDILNPVQPECVDTDAVYREFGHHLCFDGCIGTQTTMPFGSPADVRARVKDCIDRYGQKGGLLLAPTHVLEPEVPIANIEAFAAACRELG